MIRKKCIYSYVYAIIKKNNNKKLQYNSVMATESWCNTCSNKRFGAFADHNVPWKTIYYTMVLYVLRRAPVVFSYCFDVDQTSGPAKLGYTTYTAGRWKSAFSSPCAPVVRVAWNWRSVNVTKHVNVNFTHSHYWVIWF